ncbi:MAG TPA: hypothetical protein VFQ61_18530 [Polyangiaceae bacterium]|nr:hypothetical protein [Polyangiaceae bacterium]
MKRSRFFELGLVAFAATVCACCEPKLVVGEWNCPGRYGSAGESGESEEVPIPFEPVAIPWSTSFETGFCDYQRIQGFCYVSSGGSYSIVSSPVHSGKFAAAFKANGRGAQSRCITQGEFPKQAYYSAWYLVPAFASNTGNWNLLHYQGGMPPDNLDVLWDVSVSSNADGDLNLYVFRRLSRDRMPQVDAFPRIPIGVWFHIEVFVRRASDPTGELAVYQDGQLVYRATDIVTDDTAWGQWYVGNLTTSLMPPDSTVYVDDVTFSETR